MIRAALSTYAASSQRQWLQDRSQTVGASEVGRCARSVYFGKNEGDAVFGSRRDADHVDGWGARTRGSVYEDAFWAPAIGAAYGGKALFVGPDQRTFADGFLSATPDGLLIDQATDALAGFGIANIEGDSILLDCKTADPRTRLDAPKPEHVFQVIAGMGLIRALTNHRPGYAILSYTDASFWDEVKEFPVRFDEGVFEEAKRRARDVMLATSAEALKPEGVIAGGRECELCPFTAACGQIRASRVPDGKDGVTDPLLAETIGDLALAARGARDAADQFMDTARGHEEEIRALLSEAGTRRFDRGPVSVRWSPLRGRPSWDHKALREAAEAAGIDLTPFSRVGEPTDRLVITLQEIPSAAAPGEAAASAA